jgi:hypothetical protein
MQKAMSEAYLLCNPSPQVNQVISKADKWTDHHTHGCVISVKLTTTLHLQPIKEVLKWTKCHLDAYLAMAKVYLKQNIDPG